MNSTSFDILRDIAALLSYHRSAGIDSYPSCEGLERLLLKPAPGTGSADSQRPAGLAKPALRPQGRQLSEPAVLEKGPVYVDDRSSSRVDLAQEVAVCRRCDLARERVVAVAGSGGGKVRLFVVGDWLAMAGPMGSAMVFGPEQDRMLGRMLEAIHLPKEQVFVTNIIKCGIPQGTQPKAEHVRACYSYLQRQVAALRPELILAMGMLPARYMLKRQEPLSRLRGRLHSFDEPGLGKIPLVATYHPTFLLQNSGMKSATWADLKLVARQLGLPL